MQYSWSIVFQQAGEANVWIIWNQIRENGSSHSSTYMVARFLHYCKSPILWLELMSGVYVASHMKSGDQIFCKVQLIQIVHDCQSLLDIDCNHQ